MGCGGGREGKRIKVEVDEVVLLMDRPPEYLALSSSADQATVILAFGDPSSGALTKPSSSATAGNIPRSHELFLRSGRCYSRSGCCGTM